MTTEDILPDATGDNQEQTVEPTIDTPNQDGNGEQPKGKSSSYISKLQGKLGEKDEQINSLQSQINEIKNQRDHDVAYARFGDVIKDEKVQEYRTKYPDMPYEEAIRLANKTPHPPTQSYSMPGRTPGSLKSEGNKITMGDLSKLSQAEYNATMAKIDAGEIQVI